MIDLNTETTNPRGTIFADIVYNTKGSNVSHTIIDGRIIMEDRQIENIDKYQIFHHCEEIIERINSKI